jgi:hypothetical protein
VVSHVKSRTFRRGGWQAIDTYWNSPFSYWSTKAVRIDPPLPLRVRVFGSVIDASEAGWINYGGPWAVLVQTVEAEATAGQRARIEVFDAAIRVEPSEDDAAD